MITPTLIFLAFLIVLAIFLFKTRDPVGIGAGILAVIYVVARTVALFNGQ